MNNEKFKIQTDMLKEAMAREELSIRETARYLNLNPCYISMSGNPKSWDAMSQASKKRIEEWADERCKISEFRIPEGEEIWKPKEKAQSTEHRAQGSGEEKAGSGEQGAESKKSQIEENSIGLRAQGSGKEKKIKEKGKKIKGKEQKESGIGEVIKVPEEIPFELPDIPRIKFALDIEINLVVNGQRVRISA